MRSGSKSAFSRRAKSDDSSLNTYISSVLAEPDRSTFVDLAGTRLRVWEWGNPEDPVVVCLHGAFDHGRMFDELAPRVASLGYHVAAVDHRGHGDSARLFSGQVFRAAGVDVARLAAHYDQSVGIIGHSMGSAIGLGVSATWPERIRWMVSLDGLGPPVGAFDMGSLGELTKGMVDYAIKTFGRDRRIFESKAAMAKQRGDINHRVPQRWLDHLVEHGSVPNGDGWSWKWDPTFNVNLPEGFRLDMVFAEFRHMTRPLLALTGGEEDMWSEISLAEIEQRIALFADGRHYEVAGGGHYLHLEQPDAVFAHIVDFLSEIGERS